MVDVTAKCGTYLSLFVAATATINLNTYCPPVLPLSKSMHEVSYFRRQTFMSMPAFTKLCGLNWRIIILKTVCDDASHVSAKSARCLVLFALHCSSPRVIRMHCGLNPLCRVPLSCIIYITMSNKRFLVAVAPTPLPYKTFVLFTLLSRRWLCANIPCRPILHTRSSRLLRSLASSWFSFLYHGIFKLGMPELVFI